MTTEFRVCALRSQGRGFVTRLDYLRRRYPEARLLVMVPKDEDLTAEEAEYADEVLEQPHATYSIRSPRQLRDLAATLRNARLDLFIVMYPSPRLRLVAGLSGARRGECWTYENQIIPLPTAIPTAMASLLWRLMLGRIRYYRCWLTTYVRRVPMQGEVDKMAQSGPRLPRR